VSGANKIVSKIMRDEDGEDEFPADFFERYIIANQEDIQDDGSLYSFWLTGMVLVAGNASALVEIKQNRVIVAEIWGDDKGLLRDKLYQRLDSLFEDYGFVAIKSDTDTNFDGTIEKVAAYHKSDPRLPRLNMKQAAAMVSLVKNSVELAKESAPYVQYVIHETGCVLQNIFIHIISKL